MILHGADVGGASGVDTGDIGHSLRCRSSASAYLSKTFGSAANRKTFTISFWIKRTRADNTIENIFTTANDTIRFNDDSPGNQLRIVVAGATLRPARQYRDPTSPQHICIAVDTTQATAADRVRVEVNGVTETSFTAAAYPSLNADCDFGNNVAHVIGALVGPSQHLDGYFSRFCFVTGARLSASSFAYQNAEINEWVSKSQSAVKAVVDAGGTNSFMLDFDDATSLTTLGYDKSSKGNNWTCNGISLTAGPDYDHMLDVPGNSYATWNPLRPNGSSHNSNNDLTEANLRAYAPSASYWYQSVATVPVRSGEKVYVELLPTVVAGNFIGITKSPNLLSSYAPGESTDGYSFHNTLGIRYNGAQLYAGSYANTDVLALTIDRVNNELKFFKNNTLVGAAISIADADWYVSTSISSGSVTHLCSGAAPLHASATYDSASKGYFRYTPPTGFKALCQANLPTPAILNPETAFVQRTDTEANINTTLAAARAGWTDYVDILKNRDASESWAWQFSHDSSNEYAVSAGSLVRQAKRAMSGAQNWLGKSIRIGAAYGTAAGSISHTNGAATTVTHNIGKSSRQRIFLFARAGGASVPLHHADCTSGGLIDLCSTAAEAASTAITNVLTNSFQIGAGVATGTYDYFVECEMDGLLKLGKWTGNGAADGPYADGNMKPAEFEQKAINGADAHWLRDGLRNPYNQVTQILLLGDVAAESNPGYPLDIVGRGIKFRGAAYGNSNAYVYTYAMRAKVAGKYALGR